MLEIEIEIRAECAVDDVDVVVGGKIGVLHEIVWQDGIHDGLHII
jgi:hypothetical protein